jgi:hypothetical protein
MQAKGYLIQYGRQQTQPLRPHELKIVSQNEKYFEGFFERWHMKIYLEWLENTMHRNL